MREIKFRAFDKKTGHMDYELATTTCLGHDRISELMQFTGLLDKNAQEIYEHDIMSDPENDGRKYHITWNGAEYRWGAWDRGFERVFSDMHNAMVIGNVHENPELLKN